MPDDLRRTGLQSYSLPTVIALPLVSCICSCDAVRRRRTCVQAQALRSELGVAVPPGAPDVAPDTAALQDLMLLQPQSQQPRCGFQQQTQGAPGSRWADSRALVQLQALVAAVGG